MSGSLPAAVVGHPVGGSATAYSRWACRALLCFWAQSVQRVCPWFTLFGQSLHSPSFLRRSRFSRACTRESSRFSSSVSWGLVGLVVDLRLAEPARALRPGLAALRFRGRVLPALAGLGRMKVNSKVPPIAHVCGGTPQPVQRTRHAYGLSPALPRIKCYRTSVAQGLLADSATKCEMAGQRRRQDPPQRIGEPVLGVRHVGPPSY